MDLSEKISLYRSAIVGRVRQDVYAVLYERDGRKMYAPDCRNKFTQDCRIRKMPSPCWECPKKARAPVTDDVIDRHLSGIRIAGFYPLLPDGKCRLAAIDLDAEHTFEDLEKIDFYSRKFALQPYPATSTSKGWHVYFFFNRPVNAEIPQALLGHVCREAGTHPLPEIFPKQIRSSDLGNLIRTPLTIPDVKKGRCAFLDRDHGYKPFDLEQQFELLKSITPCIADEIESQVRSLGLLDKVVAGKPDYRRFPMAIRPCIRKMLEAGTSEGKRNETGLIIASELKRLNCSEEKTLGAVGVWNLRNQPPLNPSEVKTIVHSAYVNGYNYGCGSDTMKRLLGCEGGGNCSYFLKYIEEINRNQKPPEKVQEPITVEG